VNTTAESKELLRIAGTRLVTADGFGCTSCHQIGQTVPQKVALNARGTDLSLLGTRIRREWYDRWVRNPARIVPRMEMPSIVAPVRGVLHERLDDQLAAVWHVLNEPGFNPPLPNPIRVVRAGNVPEKPEPPHVLTDVLEVGDKVYSRPLVIGLSNRHNVLFDLETGRLAEWWIGDTARQRTRGKSWYWEFGGTTLVQEPPDVVPIELVIGGKHYQPKASGQFVTEFDAISHSAENQGHIEFQHRLRYEVPGRQPISLLVNQHISRVITGGGIEGAKTSKSAFFRLIEIANVPPDAEVALTVQSPQQAAIATADRTINPGTHAVVTALKGARETPRSPHPLGNADPQVARAKGTEDGVRWLELVYSTNVPVDQYIPVPVITPPPVAARLHVVPGYEATRLPLAEEEMPIALEWREDGTLIVCSLKGRVLLARDIDGDGLEDQMHPFSEELAAPYGALAHNGAIDVIAKYGLLRLHDQDGDGRAERTEVLASGWGYTTDYHDWAVGLERDAAGNYYIALPCQQDNRTPAAAHLRGQGIKLAPRKPTQDNPHHYSLEPFCAGLRFPMGLALDRGGNLFATDNQGNYNPFNELNHLMPGKRYGFINKLEFKPDFKPATESPALEIPHPWTRSVNGICFLYTPAAVREKLGRDRFGAFEGHLIGCEYDTRRLVRMSLQPIGDTFQGAVYPFSVEPPKNGEPLQGPIACRVSPQGDLYIGNIRDSGWGGDRNVGSIVRLRPSGELPAGIAEVRATAKGFSIDFTQPVDRERAANRKNYAISLYRRISTPAYGGPDVDRQSAEVKRVDVSPDGRRVELQLDKLREGFVYELHLSGLVAEGELFHPAEAHFTLRKAP
jgi:hypothetical protein